MHFKMSSAICFNLGWSKILSSGKELIIRLHDNLLKSKTLPCKENQSKVRENKRLSLTSNMLHKQIKSMAVRIYSEKKEKYSNKN